MHSRIDDFLDEVCAYVKCKAAHKEIREELSNHIYELTEEYSEQGFAEDKSIDTALMAMGNVEEIGSRLNKQHRPQTEWSLIGLTAVIAVLGGVITFLNSSRQESFRYIFERYLFYQIIGIGVLISFYFLDYTKIKKFSWYIYLTAILLILYTFISGSEVNGRKFLSISGLIFSAEYLPLLFLVAIAGFIDKGRGKGSAYFVKTIVIAGFALPFLLLLKNTSLGFMLSICYAVLIIISFIRNNYGGNRKFQFICLAGLGIISMLFMANLLSSGSYFQHRIMAFVQKSDPSGFGYQQYVANKWLESSVLFGKGIDTVNGYEIYEELPDTNTGFALVNIIATLGWAVGIACILVIALFIFRMIMTTKKIKSNYGFYLSIGACVFLSVQFVFNILMNLSMIPVIGVGLPFISYGGTGYVTNMALVGIILSVWRRNNITGASCKNTVQSTTSFIKIEDGKLIIDYKQLIRQSR